MLLRRKAPIRRAKGMLAIGKTRPQARIKPKGKARPNAIEQRHIGRIARKACLVCATFPIEIHHVMSAPDKIRRRDHRFVAPLCPAHHRGEFGVHGLGSEEKFQRIHDIDLAAWAVMEWEASNGR